jgi:dihydropyrimidinase
MLFDTCIRNGTVVSAAESFRADVGILGGRVVSVGCDLGPAAREIDALGLLVMPGGIDAHCHIEEPAYQGAVLADDFASATRAAACGGTTTIIPFVNRLANASLRASAEDYTARAEARACIDYAFHIILDQGSLPYLEQELPQLMEEGHLSVKVFMNYPGYILGDASILKVMDITRRHGGVTLVHAENGHCVHWLANSLDPANKSRMSSFAWTSPTAVEREATHRALTLAQISGARTLLVHVSAAEAAEQIRWARGRGIPILAETCPQYLVGTIDDLDRPGWEAAKFLCSPPLRSQADVDAIWGDLANGVFQIVSSDHCPYRFEGTSGKRAGGDLDFNHIPPGLPGLETRLVLLFSEGVSTGRITPEHFVAMTATNPARIYGLLPRKGTVMPGADADIVLWDPKATTVIRHADLHDDCDYTPYEGRVVTGLPVMTFSRGECLWNRGRFAATPGRGRLAERTPSP